MPVVKNDEDIIHLCIDIWNIPDGHKCVIIPIHTTSVKDKFSDYRPLGILAIFGKLYECFVLFQMSTYPNVNVLLNDAWLESREAYATCSRRCISHLDEGRTCGPSGIPEPGTMLDIVHRLQNSCP